MGTSFAALTARLLAEAVAIAERLPALAERCHQLRTLRNQPQDDALRVGVVGITSSGKSTFLNALMGETLLPEESRATTNLMVRCRHGEERQLRVRYQDGRETIFANGVLQGGLLRELCSETLNPGNEKQIAFMEWSTPTSVLPASLVLLDTPGLDAVGLKGHEELTLRHFLPSADIVIYMTSIRNPFNAADLKLVSSIMENDQRVLFVLTQADLEVDSHQHGRLWRSKEDKLSNHLERLKQDIKRQTGLKTYGVQLVSSALAKESRGDRTSAAWHRSGFEGVLDHLAAFSRELDHLVWEKRLRLLYKRLLDMREDVGDLLARGEVTPSSAREPELRRKVTALEAACVSLEDSLRSLRESASRDYRPAAWIEQVERQLRGIDSEDDDTFRKFVREVEREWDGLKNRLDEHLDAAQSQARALLDGAGVSHARAATGQAMLDSPAFPRAVDYISSYTRKVAVRGWFKSVAFWPKHEEKRVYEVDKAKFFADIKAMVGPQFEIYTRLIALRTEYLENAYLAPLRARLEEERAGLHALEQAQLASVSEREAANVVQVQLEALLREAQAALEGNAAEAIELAAVVPPAEAPAVPVRPTSHAALRPVLSLFREAAFQKEFAEFLTGRLGVTLPTSLLLVGPHREHRLRLLALLAHDLNLLSEWRSLPPDHWIVCGEATGLTLPGPVFTVAPPRTVLERVRLVLAPADEALPETDWPAVIAQFAAVGVEVAASRIDSGLSDILRAPYAHALGYVPAKAFQTCNHGALFRQGRLDHLITQVVQRATAHAPWGMRPWFIYEDYDARYTSFVQIAQALAAQEGSPRELVQHWKLQRLSLSPPFDESTLKQSLVNILEDRPDTRREI